MLNLSIAVEDPVAMIAAQQLKDFGPERYRTMSNMALFEDSFKRLARQRIEAFKRNARDNPIRFDVADKASSSGNSFQSNKNDQK